MTSIKTGYNAHARNICYFYFSRMLDLKIRFLYFKTLETVQRLSNIYFE